MFDFVFERASESLLGVIYLSLDECLRLSNKWVGSEHLLLGLINSQNTEDDNLAGRALASMSVDSKNAFQEIENHVRLNPDAEPVFNDRPQSVDAVAKLSGRQGLVDQPAFSQAIVEAMRRAEEYSVFYGSEEIEPEHLLLGLLDLKEAGAISVFEELSVNLEFLRKQVIQLIAQDAFVKGNIGGLRTSLIQGLAEFVERHYRSVKALNNLAQRSGHTRLHLPSRSEIVHMVVITYLSEFLSTQVCFQRYLLEESIRNLSQRVGMLDQETTATIVTSAAQNLRAEVRSTIEHMWCNEYRILSTMLDEAEHDLIGSVIEDLWWAQSEEIALHESFAEALDDHRRKHLLNLQQRRIEISSRLNKLTTRLNDTIKQCFLKHPISA